MDTSKLKKFAQYARRYLMEQVSTKLSFVLAADSQARRENSKAVDELGRQIRLTSRDQVVERVAYIWFNRFCAIRFMDANRYTRVGILSPAEGQFQPEILAEAKMGHIDEDLMSDATRQKVFNLLNGSIPSRDPQQEAFQILVVSACNYYNRSMPFMFEKITDFTELLIPEDLLSGNSILAYTREAMTRDICQDIEVIGWLYQFYISEKKDEVFDGLKKNKKITPENIPAATQLFTPHWIVRYMVENSLGRLWMLNRPQSRLIDQMDYYIKPLEPITGFLKIGKPEEIKLCDPACGSGHILTYSYDLLYAIYEEEGYDANEIPGLILEHNLYGIEIDERAGELSAFALTMKAAKGNPKEDTSNYRRFFRRPVQPNICILQNIYFEDSELENYLDAGGRDFLTGSFQNMLHKFREADSFGSLIRPDYDDAANILRKIEEKDLTSDLFLEATNGRVLRALKQADYLSPKYHVVVANPPYMGGKSLSGRLKAYLNEEYPDARSDLFSAFIVRNTELCVPKGQLGYMSPFVWMFISSHEKLRSFLINKKTVTSLVQLEYSGFDGATVPICAFTVENTHCPTYKGGYVRLSDFRGSANQGPKTLEAIKNPSCGWFYYASSDDIKKIPGNPIAYWINDNIRSLFTDLPKAQEKSDAAVGLQTGDNDKFLRFWYEVSFDNIGFSFGDTSQTQLSEVKWVPYNKGGAYRKWYGNRDYVVNWKNDGLEIRNFKDTNGNLRSRPQNTRYYFKPAVTWSEITSSWKSFRLVPSGSIHDVKGQSAFFENEDSILSALAWLNSNIVEQLTKVLNPTLSFQSGDYRILPMPDVDHNIVNKASMCVELVRADWDQYEISWDFKKSPLIYGNTLSYAYQELLSDNKVTINHMKQLESEINDYFLERFDLKNEIRNEILDGQITLTINPHYRYSGDKSEIELESLLLADTMREFISYAVGCMFGRYSLDRPGLILANQGETIVDYLAKVPDPTFEPDHDNVIPILDEGWFTDDITERFRKFLKITFGEEHYEVNLTFIEKSLGKKGKHQEIRDYFLKDFYADHLKRYKKRPIYWLFSSPKGSFNALIYLHRYRPDTASVVLNDYLREFRTKLSARKEHLDQISISASASPKDRTQALKDLEKLGKVIDELDDYERETLYPLATKQIPINLDDGVKFNYLLFGDALKKIPGLDAGEE